MPVPFDLDGGPLSPVVQGVVVAGLLSLFGTLAFRVWVMRRVMAWRSVDRRLGALAWGSLGMAAAGLAGWLVLQTVDMAGAHTLGQALAALPVVAWDTDFGHVILLQMAALAATAGFMRRLGVATALAGLACALQAGHSHAASMNPGPSWLLASDVVHLLAAGAWLGGLLPLLIAVQGTPAGTGAVAARWFSPLGKLCLVAMAGTAAFQGWVLVGSLPGLVGTGYGWMALLKLALFGVLTGFAWVNRYRLAPALMRGDAAAAKARLVRSVALQTGFGLAVVAAAAVLSSMAPAMHQQPVWPFPDLFTLDTVREDPDFMREAIEALVALGVAAGLGVAALLVTRRALRWTAAGAAAVIAWFAVPHLDLLFVPATPTSFFHSPTDFAADSIVAGAALYPSHCAACHGAAGHGDGPAARGLPVPPADLTAAHLWMHSDGELFWWLSHGIEAPEGGTAMPGFAGSLTEDQRWALIDYIRAHNGGLAFHASGAFPQPLQAPAFQAVCAGGRTVSLADLRGGYVRLAFGRAPAPLPGVTTIVMQAGVMQAGVMQAGVMQAGGPPPAGDCAVADEAVPAAYAAVLGTPVMQAPGGTQVLIDGDGWLRDAGHWDAASWPAEQESLRMHPVTATPMAKMDMPM